ncbi:hypothetical protein G3A_13145 [Bacillus sp. 17376]|uniref:Serine kinase n=1 Tax=Mesobacillus boroniphilus JCM 21738 TaxID=1294265 RepID=W4RJU9_9BACI|nr:hypothetical protein [Mesobacillus boroniphilus]ESU32076.1 hypothetical protein G3A_13145 [Bacillus sp. 17376]GAE44158.1 serine kinase [Mesobacillus boroniphilus JCM 21738]
MIGTDASIHYEAFGLKIKSMITLPELKVAGDRNELHEVVITEGDLNQIWSSKTKDNGKFFVEGNTIMFRIRDTATFLVKDGHKIIVSPKPNADPNKIRLYILGTCIGVILMQRKIFALHGSAIDIYGKAYAFVGHSGAGKSTLASAFINRGFNMLSDDIIPVSMSKNGVYYVNPTYPQQKLWEESLLNFEMDSNNYKPLFERENKFAVPVQSNYCDCSLPLAGVFEIIKTKEENVSIMPVVNLERFRLLFNQTFRQSLISRLGLLEWHFSESARIIKQISMYQIYRPSTSFTAPELVEKILKKISEGESLNVD